MKRKVSPVFIVIGLILVVGLVGVISLFINRYTPSGEKENLNTYFGISQDDQAALIVNNEISETPGLYQDGEVYIKYETMTELLDTNFYWEESSGQMLLTLPDEIRTIQPGDTAHATQSGAPALVTGPDGGEYLALNFVKEYADMECEVYQEPARAVIRTRWTGVKQVTAVKDTKVRVRGGIKSNILEETAEGENMTLLETLDNWSKVGTQKGCIGYVENEAISDASDLPAHPENPELAFQNISRDYKINLGWHQVTSPEGNAAFPGLVSEAKGLTTISPTWFKLADNEGTVTSIASREYVDQAHAMGLEVWGLVDNFSENVTTAEVLSDSARRSRIIDQLMQAAADCGMDGINVDFEQLTKEGIPHFLQFLRELTLKAHEKNLVVSVDNPVPQNYNKYYKRGAQGRIADYIIIMGYDEHYGGGEEAGSVASLPFVEKGIGKMLEEVPAAKVINAIPFYTRVWTETYGQEVPTSEVLGMDGADRYIQENGLTKEWDPSVGQNVASAEDENARYTIWLEDEQSIEEKMKVIQSYGLAGVAEWRLGLERSSVWEIIGRYLN